MRTVVMTGGTSGFGRQMFSQLRHPDRRIVIGARGARSDGIASLPLDLSNLASVRQFAGLGLELIAETPIDALILNAGLHSTDPNARSIDGYEMTFATNHLGHYLLLRLLMHRLADDATIVITTSGTHDPAERAGFPIPRHADARLLAHPEQDSDIDVSSPIEACRGFYAASKLANLLTALRLARLAAEQGRGWTVLAFCPGQVPGTGLVRDYPVPMRLGWRLAGTLADTPFLARLMGVNTVRESAAALAALAQGDVRPPQGRVYAAVRRGKITWPEPSKLASRDDVADAMWRDSATLVGLSEDCVP